MKFSKKIWKLSESPKFKKEIKLSNHIIVTLNRLKTDISLHFGTKKEEEVLISQIFYETDYNGPYLGAIDGFISLIQGKPVEATDRFPIKELDYFLRDSQDEPAFTAYSQELYEIIAIGEKIKEHVFGRKKHILFEFGPDQDFSTMAASEQFELIEEFLSVFYYKQGVDLDDIECLDIDDLTIIFKASSKHHIDLKLKLQEHIDNKIETKFE